MKEKLKNMTVMEIICWICCIVFFIIGVYIVLLQSNKRAQFDADYAMNKKTINELTTELNSIDEVVETEELAVEKLSSAAAAGNKVAELQNKYQDINVNSPDDAIITNAEAIDKYLADSDKAKRVPWYNAHGYTWEFNTTYSFTEKTVPVLWTCYDKNGTLVAYTTGTYNAESQLFFNVDYHLTMVGSGNVESTGINSEGVTADGVTDANITVTNAPVVTGFSEYGAPEPERADGSTVDSVKAKDLETNNEEINESEVVEE